VNCLESLPSFWWKAFVEVVVGKFEFGWNKIFYEVQKLKIEL